MPRNTGEIPAYELVDIEYANGHVVRGIDPEKRRWTIADPAFPAGEWDIAKWQPAGPARALPHSMKDQAA